MSKKKGSFTRRKFIKTVSAAAAITALENQFPFHVFASVPKKVKIGVLAPSHCALPIVNASLRGLYKKNGIDAELVYLPDMKDLAQGLMKKEIEAAQIISSVFFAINAGSGPFKGKETPLITAQVAGTNGGVLVTKKGSGMRQLEDLKGKKIGVHSPLMVHTLLFKTLLRQKNIVLGKDVELRVINMKELMAALKSGAIDGFINPEPIPTFSKNKGVGEDMLMTRMLWHDHPCCVVAMRRDFYQQNRETANALYMASLESGMELNDKHERIVAIKRVHEGSRPYNQFPLTWLLDAFMTNRSDFYPFPFLSSGKTVLLMMRESDMLPPSVNIESMVKETFLADESRELMTALKMKAPSRNYREEKVAGKVFS